MSPLGSISGGSISGSVGGSQIAPGKVTNVQVTSLASLARRSGGRETITFKVGPTGVANSVVNCPAYRVGPDQKVQLIANQSGDSVSETRETAAAQNGDPLPVGVVVEYPVDNTGKLWFFLGGNGDSVTVRILSAQ